MKQFLDVMDPLLRDDCRELLLENAKARLNASRAFPDVFQGTGAGGQANWEQAGRSGSRLGGIYIRGFLSTLIAGICRLVKTLPWPLLILE